MKLTVKQKPFEAALAAADRIAAKISPVPVATHVRLAASESILNVAATDYDAWFLRELPAAVETAGGLCVSAHMLHRFVAGLDGKNDVTLTADKGNLRVRSGRASVLLGGVPADTFPMLTAREDANLARIELPCQDLRGLLQRTLPAMADDELRPFLGSVHLAGDGVHLLAEATTGALMLRQTLAHGGTVPDVILPRSTVKALAAMIPSSGTAQLAVSRGWGWAGVAWPRDGHRESLTTKIYGDKYPDLGVNLRPGEAFDTVITVNGGALQAALGRLSQVIEAKHRRGVDLVAGETSLHLATVSGANAGEDELAATACEGSKESRRRVNVDFFARAAQLVDGEAVLAFRAAQLDRFVLTDTAHPGWLCLLMAMA